MSLNNFLINTILITTLIFSGCDSDSGSSSTSATGNTSITTGKSGSMSRFAIDENTLYTISGNRIKQYDITQPEQPLYWSSATVSDDIETLFVHNEYMFIGSMTGIYIYEINSLGQLDYVSNFMHVQSCDPVVVEGDYAYVTLRGDSACSINGLNEFDIIDISDISNPKLVSSWVMEGPMGLGVDDNQVFVCDGDAGLKVFNVEDPENITIADHQPVENCYDVIPDQGQLLVRDLTGLTQYDYTKMPMTLLSSLEIYNN
ncbi:MAG: hypothetical protein JXR91_11790 [Deltaproteobacteria bacterium]|nr:hypothetical protein [Deltaproteobacteria bacterium]